ncbi:hypothetical protein NPIL_700331, partial [Nephila pilipes]
DTPQGVVYDSYGFGRDPKKEKSRKCRPERRGLPSSSRPPARDAVVFLLFCDFDPLNIHRFLSISERGLVSTPSTRICVLRPAQRGQKPRVEQKGKSWLDPDFQYEYGPLERRLAFLRGGIAIELRAPESREPLRGFEIGDFSPRV